MKRRDFIKLSILGGAYILAPTFATSADIDIATINFSSAVYNQNAAQTIIVYLYGGASQLSGNLTNLDEIEKNSNKSYTSYFSDRLTKTENGFWEEAGGEYLEKMLSNGDMTIFRTCYSEVREESGNKAHGVCSEQNQKGSFDTSGAGVISNIAYVLQKAGVVNENMLLPFVTLEGESIFYQTGDLQIDSYLKAASLSSDFNNPYERNVRSWLYYTPEERTIPNYYKSDEDGGFDPALSAKMDSVASRHNKDGKIKDFFDSRAKLDNFIEEVKSATIPDLGDDEYEENNTLAQRLKAAVTLLDKNSDTKIITVGSGGLGGWDDHSDGRDYITRSQSLFRAINSAMSHIKALNKDGKINIMVFAEFGRNVNLNDTFGWDHGNLQNFYIFGGKDYFNHKGIVGETVLDVAQAGSRLWLKPASNSYWFEPLSIAATIYKIYGIENPEKLTGGYGAVNIV